MKENIFADLYNKVISFFISNEETSEQTKVAAKNRLKTDKEAQAQPTINEK